MPPKLDLKKELKNLYSIKGKDPVIIDVPELKILSVQGKGDPNNSKEFSDAIEALYPVAYHIKFYCKNELGKDFGVMPMEGLWWTEPMEDFDPADKSNWLWKIFIVQPEFISEEIFKDMHETVKKKKNPTSIDKVRFETITEGKSGQIMHIGPFSEEAENIRKLHYHIKEQGGTFDGLIQKHHEIYLSDMRRTAPEKLRTIIRQPFL